MTAAAAGLGAELAVAVLSLRGDPHVADAVRSLVQQDPRPEVVVVHSGGGGPGPVLHVAGLEVPVVEHRERLLPGAARNEGIRSTRAPYVGFLASDCLALPGWVAGRLRAHQAGAPVVASLIANAYPDSRSACAAALLLHHRRMPHAPPAERIQIGGSFARSLFDRFGLFREDLRTGEDTEFADRLTAAGVAVETAAGVLTAHRNPRSPAALLRDQYARGARQQRARAELGLSARWLPAATVLDAALAWRWAGREADPRARRALRRGWPLLLPGAVAYAAGTIAGGRGREGH